jgi:hypothetical protein
MKKHENYILFIDESGKSKLSDDHGDFLLTGLIIDKNLHQALSDYMISLKEKSGVPTDENIHAFDLFEAEREKVYDREGKVSKKKDGKRKHKNIPNAKINLFFERLAYLIEGADLLCFTYSIDKTPYRNKITRVAKREGARERAVIDFVKRKGLNDFLYEALTRKLILEFGHFLEERDAYGEVVAESRRQEDDAVLRAFNNATRESNFSETPRFLLWSEFSVRRIHSLTFQNKRGLSFGLEVADLFSWAQFNHMNGRSFPIASVAKNKRVDGRIARVESIMQSLYKKKKPEKISGPILRRVAGDRVSEFDDVLRDFRRKV